MEYHGKLYGHLGNGKYFDTGSTTQDWDAMVKRIAELEAQLARQPQPVTTTSSNDLLQTIGDMNLNDIVELLEFIDKEISAFNAYEGDDYSYEYDVFMRELAERIKVKINYPQPVKYVRIEDFLASYGFAIKTGKEQKKGSAADIYAEHADGSYLLIEDGRVALSGAVNHVYAPGGKVFEGKVENQSEMKGLLKMLGYGG